MRCAWATALLWLTAGITFGEPADDSARLAALLEKVRQGGGTPALAAAMVRGGKITAAAAVGVRKQGDPTPVALDDRFHIGSDTKSMTATLAAALVEKGKISWGTTIAQALPELADKIRAEYRDVTLEQLLTHRSGLPDNDHLENGLWGKIWQLAGPMREQRREGARLTLGQAPLAKPGEKTLYTNLGYMVAGTMLEAAAGKTWEELLRELLFVPLGMKTAGFGAPGTAAGGAPDQPRGHRRKKDGTLDPMEPGPTADNPAAMGPGGTAHCSIEDFARYAALHLAGARGEKGLLLAPESFAKLHTPPAGGEYAMGWIVAQRPWAKGRVLTHAGSNTMWFAVVWIAPERDAAFVAACNRADEQGGKDCDAAIAGMIQEFLK